MQPELTQVIVPIGAVGIGAILFRLGMLTARRRGERSGRQLVRCLAQPTDAPEFSMALDESLRGFMSDIGADLGYIRLIDPRSPNSLKVVAAHSEHAPVPLLGDLTDVAEGLSGIALSQRQVVLITDTGKSAILKEEFIEIPTSALLVPITVTEATGSAGASTRQAVGVVVLGTRGKSKPISKSSLTVAKAWGEAISLMVQARQLTEFSRETILDSLQEIADFLDSKDPFTAGHSRRTAEVARIIARRMGLEDQACHEIWSAAKLIDLGKVAVPDAILKKNSGLSDEEFETVKKHPLVSYDICRKLRLPDSVLMIVRNHHERLDGSGYPDQLRGGELPLALNIVAVADAYDAMRCARPHRPGLSAEEALHQLIQESGTKHDPSVVEAVRVLTEDHELEHLYADLQPKESILRVA